MGTVKKFVLIPYDQYTQHFQPNTATTATTDPHQAILANPDIGEKTKRLAVVPKKRRPQPPIPPLPPGGVPPVAAVAAAAGPTGTPGAGVRATTPVSSATVTAGQGDQDTRKGTIHRRILGELGGLKFQQKRGELLLQRIEDNNRLRVNSRLNIVLDGEERRDLPASLFLAYLLQNRRGPFPSSFKKALTALDPPEQMLSNKNLPEREHGRQGVQFLWESLQTTQDSDEYSTEDN